MYMFMRACVFMHVHTRVRECMRACMRACMLTVGTRDMCMFDIFMVINVLSCFFYIILTASRFRL